VRFKVHILNASSGVNIDAFVHRWDSTENHFALCSQVNLKFNIVLAVDTTENSVQILVAGSAEDQCVSYITRSMNTSSIHSRIAHVFMNVNSVQCSMFLGAPGGLQVLRLRAVGRVGVRT
jgi:hypothetical protein